jgi:hypothetical protein
MRKKLWLCLPPLVLCLADQIVTLRAQPQEYWTGLYHMAQEGAPHGYWLFSQHPLAYIAAAAGYMVAFSLVILALPRRLAETASIALVLGHAWGTATWLYHDLSYWCVLLLYFLSAALIVFALAMSEVGGRRE